MGLDIHSLTIVIPAFNEASAIGDTISRCLEAREYIKDGSGIVDIELIVVSDGSSDGTEAIARGFPEVTVLSFAENRGYGAAIKCGFHHGRGDLVAFLDADGTCDPRDFNRLCRALRDEDADIVLGSRMGSGSRMPLIRVAGNTLFAWMLGLLSKRRISDTASGMRVLRRSALDDLYPLPNGLHFTPAMTARALLEDKLRLVEVPIAYAERVGRSKLSVAKDGLLFLASIAQAAICYRPARPLLVVATAIGVLAVAVGFLPVRFYLENNRLEEWMIYRMLLSSLLITISAFVVCTAVTTERIAATAHGRAFATAGVTATLSRLFGERARHLVNVVLLSTAILLVWPGINEFLSTGHVTMHWSRALLASQLVLLVTMQVLTTFVLAMVNLIERQKTARQEVARPDRLHHAEAPDS
jgi:glycosyltransferase involved in cell wall biosynthesis